MLQQENIAKEEWSALLQAQIQRFKDYPGIDEFKIEALELSKIMSQ